MRKSFGLLPGPLWLSATYFVANQWLRYDLGTPTPVAQVAVCFNDPGGPGRSPKDLRIEGSNDGLISQR